MMSCTLHPGGLCPLGTILIAIHTHGIGHRWRPRIPSSSTATSLLSSLSCMNIIFYLNSTFSQWSISTFRVWHTRLQSNATIIEDHDVTWRDVTTIPRSTATAILMMERQHGKASCLPSTAVWWWWWWWWWWWLYIAGRFFDGSWIIMTARVDVIATKHEFRNLGKWKHAC